MNDNIINEENEKVAVATAMVNYGGGFVKHLGEALFNADMYNTRIIKNSFPHYWKQYKEMSELSKKG